MTTIWERMQQAVRAAGRAFSGDTRAWADDDLTNEEKERRSFYDRAWKYYRGLHKEPLLIKAGSANDNVLVNYSRRVVDKGVAFLFGKPVMWDLPTVDEVEGESLADQEEKTDPIVDALQHLWGSPEKLHLFLTDLATSGAVCGTFYIQIPVDANGDLELPIVLDPYVVIPKYEPTNVDRVVSYHLRWKTGDYVYRQVWAVAAASEDSSEIGDYWMYWKERKGPRGTWEEVEEQQVWPYPFPPILHGKNLPNPHSFYGRSDLEDADLNDAINAVASNTNRLIRRFAHPTVWGYGWNVTELAVPPGRAVISTDPDAKLESLGHGVELRGSAEFLQQLKTSFAEITGVPNMDPNNLRMGAMSGFALRVLYSDLLEKTGVKRASYGSVLVELMRRCAALMGSGDDVVVTLSWPDPLPVDEGQQVLGLTFDSTQSIVSKQTLSAKRGYNYDDEQALIGQEKKREGDIGSALLDRFETGHGGVEDQQDDGSEEVVPEE